MDINEAVETLKAFNAWRRGEDSRTMQEAKIETVKVGVAIDTAVAALEVQLHGEQDDDTLRGFYPFDYERAIRGAQIITRNGRRVQFVVPEDRLFLAKVAGYKWAIKFSRDGRYIGRDDPDLDLYMEYPPETKA